ncbi:protein SLC31A2-like [Mytilus galloprovincialis]|uniref:protein SLC31A2-like n=1 Tax=Mytilus galloprovincialis TaxID=29158 RepID=UPI003F7B413F
MMNKVLTTYTTSNFLFLQWKTDDHIGLVVGMITTVVLGVLFESLHLIESKLQKGETSDSKRTVKMAKCAFVGKRTAIHMTRVVLGYVLMLCVMIMNVWIIGSVVLGYAIGYFLFRPWTYTRNSTRSSKSKIHNGLTEQSDKLLTKESDV